MAEMKQKRMAEDMLEISRAALIDEVKHIKELTQYIKLNAGDESRIQLRAKRYVDSVRGHKSSVVEGFIHEFSLSTEEGVAIMCLAESLLRIPDNVTAQKLLEDKLGDKNWLQHIDSDNSLFINASSLGLMIAGKIVSASGEPGFSFTKLLGKMTKPIMLKAIKRAIKLISNQYILGEDLPSALRNAQGIVKKGSMISFDILGESSRTQKQAEFYYNEYVKAIECIAKYTDKNAPIYNNHNLSVKLTALHPRVLYKKRDLLKDELLPKLKQLVRMCVEANISLSFDAEEAYRQDMYLELLMELVLDEEFKGFDGIGFVLQAYQKRTFFIIDRLAELARKAGKRVLIRLVKGAYWDSEIKLAQEHGLEGYPVFTRKENTDVSYIACAQKILQYGMLFYPQFATHNAHTMASVIQLAGDAEFEFQRLQGMGPVLHEQVIAEGYKSRIYAPVGKYEDLLAYLMRRLLENGANNSFVNLMADKNITVSELIYSPLVKVKKSIAEAPAISLPGGIYGVLRANSQGYDVGYSYQFVELEHGVGNFADKRYDAKSLIDGGSTEVADERTVLNPARKDEVIGKLVYAGREDIKRAVDTAAGGFARWALHDVWERASILRRVAAVLHEHRYELYSLLIREAGKNIDDCVAEVREAIDFAEYYATMAERICGTPIALPGYTGESNQLSWHPKGIFVCISPWNFPLAIFTGQILAALVAGNAVLAKPADNTSLIATFAVELFYKAGVPKDALQLILARGRQISEVLLSDVRVSGVCFTGSTDVALSINRTLAARNAPIASIIAETGGQNAMIVDSSALLEQAADSIIYSAFGSIGQRCSALRVVYVQEEIADRMEELLCGYMDQLSIGCTADFKYDLGPVIDEKAKLELEAHIEDLSTSKSAWLIGRHRQWDDAGLANGNFVAPHIFGIKGIDVLHKEHFGPILHVIRYRSADLNKIIEEVNSTGYGLTFGVQTRIERRIYEVAGKVEAGNLYANRTMIGAHVGTQPFGGEGSSGTGFKAGGPHYLYKFMNERVLTINTSAIGGNLELLRSCVGLEKQIV